MMKSKAFPYEINRKSDIVKQVSKKTSKANAAAEAKKRANTIALDGKKCSKKQADMKWKVKGQKESGEDSESEVGLSKIITYCTISINLAVTRHSDPCRIEI